jgi:hypothetical protein
MMSFVDRLDKFKERMSNGELENREYRLLNFHLALKEYLNTCKERPSNEDIYKLTEMILHEELSDNHPDKMTREEYPILSDAQLARRQEGKHVKNNDKTTRIEVPLEVASEYGTDMRSYKYPKRRVRSERENVSVNKRTGSENRLRKLKHKAFVDGQDYVEVINDRGEKEKKSIEFIRKNVKIN